jgi:uncharacterized protein
MRIFISGRAEACKLDTDDPITDPKQLQKLHGLLFSKEKCLDNADSPLEEIGVEGGELRLLFDKECNELRIVTEYYAPRRLTHEELKQLAADTTGQWSDGIGEDEFQYRSQLKMEVNLYPLGANKIKAKQIEGGTPAPPPVQSAPPLPSLSPLFSPDEASEAIKRLRAQKIELHRVNKYGQTALHESCRDAKQEIVMLLLQAGANVNAKSKDGDTPLSLLAMVNPKEKSESVYLGIANALVAFGASVDAANEEGMTPLMWATNRANFSLMKFLIQKGANVNARSTLEGNQNTVLMHSQNRSATELLLSAGADPWAQNDSGENAYEQALWQIRHGSLGFKEPAELLAKFMQSKRG